MSAASDRRIVVGVVLIAIGLSILATDLFGVADAFVIGSIAVVLLVAYALTRRYGFLVPGMILAGAAVATGVQDAGYDESGGFVAIYLGAGFLGVWVLDLFAHGPSRWWPLVPGMLLVFFGVATVTEATAAGRFLEQLWPLALVVAGVAIIATAMTRGRKASTEPRGSTMPSK